MELPETDLLIGDQSSYLQALSDRKRPLSRLGFRVLKYNISRNSSLKAVVPVPAQVSLFKSESGPLIQNEEVPPAAAEKRRPSSAKQTTKKFEQQFHRISDDGIPFYAKPSKEQLARLEQKKAQQLADEKERLILKNLVTNLPFLYS
jgi:hypothetical protein